MHRKQLWQNSTNPQSMHHSCTRTKVAAVTPSGAVWPRSSDPKASSSPAQAARPARAPAVRRRGQLKRQRRLLHGARLRRRAALARGLCGGRGLLRTARQGRRHHLHKLRRGAPRTCRAARAASRHQTSSRVTPGSRPACAVSLHGVEGAPPGSRARRRLWGRPRQAAPRFRAGAS